MIDKNTHVVPKPETIAAAERLRRLRQHRDHAEAARPIQLARIVETSCEVMGVSPSEFVSRSRMPKVVYAHWICAVLCRRLTTASYPEIARAMGRPTHSTIIAAVQRMELECEMDAEISDKPVYGDLSARQLVEKATALLEREAES